jgi:hypothetical protein
MTSGPLPASAESPFALTGLRVSGILKGMLTLERTITVPADRRVSLHWDFEVPETVPTGEMSVVLTFPEPESDFADDAEVMAIAQEIMDEHSAAFRELAK